MMYRMIWCVVGDGVSLWRWIDMWCRLGRKLVLDVEVGSDVCVLCVGVVRRFEM